MSRHARGEIGRYTNEKKETAVSALLLHHSSRLEALLSSLARCEKSLLHHAHLDGELQPVMSRLIDRTCPRAVNLWNV